ncbi:orotidine-5'-phosphate decarboxylase [Bacillus sp. KH172YL63]|uniref:orotidine-5'-phosphate decarboxylase n=1 Tax=Bacillus sp. KH172YL63 TaxID=2709784 RepID=UPI0013E4583E|nr:orotidine-5'-phosphate decarboxylase [Bacillus sp. KH172YL63]BCB03294.1 orotidine 5'-phosphate decarboxylase [Bacillus sp. KH172YL63]
MNQKPFIALDFPTWERTESFLALFREPLNVKVGMELYFQHGPWIIEEILKKQHRIFLDLKLHDIPNTVYRAMKGLAGYDLEMVNVHAAGGSAMMERALEGLYAGVKANQKRPKLIAVTQLTSTSEEQMQKEQLIRGSINESVLHYSKLAKNAGLDGVVCSPHEANMIREHCGEKFIRVTPGIRQPDDRLDDQTRVTTPRMARESGSSYIVVGRSITGAADPVLTYERVMHEWEGKE